MSLANKLRIALGSVLAAAALFMAAPRLTAQAVPLSATETTASETAPSNTAPAAAEVLSSQNLFDILKDGGPMMIPLFVCSFLTLVFLFERAISLRRGRVVPRPFVKRFLHQVGEGKLDRDGALELCRENGSPIADVFASAVRKWGRPSVELEQSVIDAGERVGAGLRRYIRLFNAVATISPLMGLLGTVFGMIRMFNSISTAEAPGRTELLAAGISEALFTTAAGLMIAIPALCFYLYFLGRVESLLSDIDARGQELVGLISAESLHDERQSKLRSKGRPTAAA